MKLKYPLTYISITQYYKKPAHNGLDLGWSYNYGGKETPIYAAADGVVESIRNDYNKIDPTGSSYGNYVKIKHDNNISTLYAHLKYQSVLVKAGDKVKQGDKIGTMGETGRADGIHLHYEVFINNEKVDPLLYTYVYKDQIVSTNSSSIKGLLYNEDPIIPSDQIDNTNKKIKELEDKIKLQEKEIEILKEELAEKEKIKFKYNVLKTSIYEIVLNEGEILYIK